MFFPFTLIFSDKITCIKKIYYFQMLFTHVKSSVVYFKNSNIAIILKNRNLNQGTNLGKD